MRYLANVSTLRLDAARCSGCGRCAEVCPHGVFAVREARAVVVDRDACMECGACRQNCAEGAIDVQPGVGCAMALVGAMVARRRSRQGARPTCGSCGPRSP